MKKKFWLLLIMFFMFASVPAKAVDIGDLLSRIGFNLSMKKDDKAEITKVIEKQQKYANKKNLEKLKSLYSEDYANFDGISLDEYLESIKKTWSRHSKLTYITNINSIEINGDYATVNATDIAEGTTKDSFENIEGSGDLYSVSKSIYYLKREKNDWKVSADLIISEKTSLKYGVAKNMDIKIQAPECVKAGSEYSIKLTAQIPDKMGMIASIINEPIEYPQIKKTEDIFRPTKQDGELERVVKANEFGNNEVAFASLAVAEASVNSDSTVDILMNGAAFVATRVNVVPNINKVIKEKKEMKEAGDNNGKKE